MSTHIATSHLDAQFSRNSEKVPILTAFEDEFRRLCQSYGARFIGRVFQYLVGTEDFYKVVRVC